MDPETAEEFIKLLADKAGRGETPGAALNLLRLLSIAYGRGQNAEMAAEPNPYESHLEPW